MLTQFFSETRGGGEHVFKLLANSLAKNNHKIWIITNKIKEERYNSQENLNIIFVRPTLSYSGKPPSFSDNVRYCINTIREGLKIIKKERIDVIHSNNFAPALSGAILSSITSKPHILTVHDVFSLCGSNYRKMWGAQADVSKINAILTPLFEKLIIRSKHDCIHTVSEATKDDLIQLGAKKPIHVIHNIIGRHLQKQESKTNSFEFVYIGRLVFYKNLEVAIKAINIARKSEPHIKLVIAGDGPHRHSLEELTKTLGLEQNIEFRGYVNSDEKTRLLASSCGLVFPSLCEGFGIVILEAFDQSKPVLVSNVRPMSDIVSDGKNGFVLDPHDENQWADYLLRIKKNSQEASEMGKNGNRLLATSYTEELMYQKIMKMYQNVLNKN
ncbi:MAG: glycosyltransferase family 4 protein [Nitrosotalea sp.]